LVDPPKGIKPIGYKWVFKRKNNMNGNVQIYKVRLVVKGYKQRHEVNFDEILLQVAMLKSLKIFFDIA
jgi:hypothetical protein